MALETDRRTRKRLARRRELLDIAADLWDEGGPEALTLAAQRAHDLSRESYRHYQLFFASDRDLARQHMIAKEYWTAVERFLVQMGGRQPVDPDAHPPEPEPEPEPPAKRRWLRR